jgi:hypothetical protein
LIPLYKERLKILCNFFYIRITPKPGFSFLDLGIPSTKTNNSILDKEIENRAQFIENNEMFLDEILPYSDTVIINGIIYFEEILENLNCSHCLK